MQLHTPESFGKHWTRIRSVKRSKKTEKGLVNVIGTPNPINNPIRKETAIPLDHKVELTSNEAHNEDDGTSVEIRPLDKIAMSQENLAFPIRNINIVGTTISV
jgi:hypothetical protein